MNRGTLALLLVLLAALVAACRLPAGPTQQVTVTVSLGPSPSPAPTPVSPDCSVVSITVSSNAGSTFAPNDVVTLDATPLGKNGAPLGDSCPTLPISWSFESNTAACVLQGAITTYNPDLLCASKGRVSVLATIAGASPGRAVFTVQ